VSCTGGGCDFTCTGDASCSGTCTGDSCTGNGFSG
jgi:hypothetical protein